LVRFDPNLAKNDRVLTKSGHFWPDLDLFGQVLGGTWILVRPTQNLPKRPKNLAKMAKIAIFDQIFGLLADFVCRSSQDARTWVWLRPGRRFWAFFHLGTYGDQFGEGRALRPGLNGPA